MKFNKIIFMFGVIATLTLLVITKVHADSNPVNMLKSYIAFTENKFAKYMQSQNAKDITETELYKNMPSKDTDLPDYENFVNKKIKEIFDVDYTCYSDDLSCKKVHYHKLYTSKADKYESHSCPDDFYAVLKDGRIIYFDARQYGEHEFTKPETIEQLGGKLKLRVATIYLDINGYQPPNIWGLDMFGFYLGQDGKLYPFFGKDNAINTYGINWKSSDNYWKSKYSACGSSDTPINSGETVHGNGCAARIIENNWVRDY